MTFAIFFEILLAALKFPSELSAFVRLISKSPQEKKDEIMVQVSKWMDDSASSPDGRPTWEHP